MNKKGHVMKLLLTGCGMFLFLILWSTGLEAVSINWGTAGNPLFSENGVGSEELEEGDIVQLICDRARDGINPPSPNGQPSGDDELVHTSRIGQGSFYPGEFSANITTGSIGIGDYLYVRAWNDSTLESANRWGDTRQHTPQEWVVDNSLFYTVNITENGSWATTFYRLMVEKRVLESKRLGVEGSAVGSLVFNGVSLTLSYPCPNPFRFTTSLRLSIEGQDPGSMLSLEIYNARGGLVRTLFKGEASEGVHEVSWDGTDSRHSPVASGVYLCRLQVGQGQNRRSLVMKIIRAD
jgi:hypothetical protein